MINYIVRGDYQGFVLIALVLIIALSLHEFGHAFAADRQGDPTARQAGRLTLNPIKHLDPFGTLAIVLVGFGWGKPVPFNPRGLRSQRFGPALVALAGPIVNVVLAFIAAITLAQVGFRSQSAFSEFLQLTLFLNALLAIFNLIPIPPLDGSRLLTLFLPPSKHQWLFFLDRWGFLILLVLVFWVFPGALSRVAGYFAGAIFAIVS